MDGFLAHLAELAQQGRLPGVFAFPFLVRGGLAALLVAPLLGGMSHLVVARRLAFLSTALGQAALTGLTIGILAGESIDAPYGGILGFSLLSALAIVFIKRRASLPTDTLIGVFAALTLGLGICLLVAVTKRFNIHQLEAVMFGSLLTVTDVDLALLLVAAIGIGATLAWHYNALLTDGLSSPLAKAAGANTALVDYLFVLLLTAAITMSLKIIGALLVEALVVVPAAAARNLARSTRGYLIWSICIALSASLIGLYLSTRFAVPSGGAIVLALAASFFVTLVVGAIRSRLSRAKAR